MPQMDSRSAGVLASENAPKFLSRLSICFQFEHGAVDVARFLRHPGFLTGAATLLSPPWPPLP